MMHFIILSVSRTDVVSAYTLKMKTLGKFIQIEKKQNPLIENHDHLTEL